MRLAWLHKRLGVCTTLIGLGFSHVHLALGCRVCFEHHTVPHSCADDVGIFCCVTVSLKQLHTCTRQAKPAALPVIAARC